MDLHKLTEKELQFVSELLEDRIKTQRKVNEELDSIGIKGEETIIDMCELIKVKVKNHLGEYNE
ncbi:hypothetical protein [Halalkalibacter urbisdiaboli]|uniref:hypothetical protein n=1 Tax=Halalkalibacter urbisdiaboli TaxID=1960589 RepID=UPI000B43AF6D|nr:hypothetical protein [Halalkalibacter urbisdiaboli]